ncbi:MAG: peroxiredoxin [Proteobacteria bacterium]|jgi:thioredoxin-dependent peroxiredoxin|nr:peroxiredoxin [Pseudomonadota bacterium]
MLDQLLWKFMLDVGNAVNLEQFKKGSFVVYFYPKDNTPGCTIEAQDFSKLLSEFKKLGVEVYGVSQDDEQSHQKFTNECKLSVPLIADVNGIICNAFGAIGEKTNFGKTYIGIIRSTFIVKDGVVVKRWKAVQVKDHAQKVLEAVKTLV